MTSRQTTLIIGAALLGGVLFVILVVVLVAGGGGGESDSEAEIGQLTNPQDVPTAPPWDQPPEVIILDPNAITPIGVGEPTPVPIEGAAGGGGPKNTMASGDTFSSVAGKGGSRPAGGPGADP